MDSSLTALSPVDGRYRAATEALARLLSESGLIKERIRVEALWVLQLGETLSALPAAAIWPRPCGAGWSSWPPIRAMPARSRSSTSSSASITT